jgi:predicted DNA-binding transcriptional regulator AlpA
MTEHHDLLTQGEAAKVVRVTTRTLQRWAAQGIGPQPVRHGPRLVRYLRPELERWLTEGDRPRGPEAAWEESRMVRARRTA